MHAPFEVLPHGGLDQSILLPVLIGVYIALFFTETFGWVFVGLVVPGYLASVLALQPTTAAVIVLEAIATYVIARGLAYALAPTGVWAPFFGRDRFFVIVLVSILVRQHDQLWILPALSSWLEGQLGVDLPPVREFYSIGLVLVPLAANMLWRPGIVRGLGPLAVVVGLTYAALQLALLPLTNLSLSSFELLYEDSAIDFLGHARAYVLLLTTATLAARFNLRFGWDFGGILVPALLCLLWFTPREMAVTLIEACALWALATLLLRYSPLRRFNLEGPRKLVLVFTLSVIFKWVLSLVVTATLPGLRARELFGFGYLLSTLLALRMLPKKAARRVLLPTVLTALVGWLVGGALGLGLDAAAPSATPVPAFSPKSPSVRLLRSEAGALALARVRAELAPPRREDPDPDALRARAVAWTALEAWLAAPSDEAAAAAREAAAAADLAFFQMSSPTGLSHHVSYAVAPVERGAPGVTWPLVLVIPGASGPAIAVPRPTAEPPTAEAAGPLCAALGCRLVLVAGRDQEPGVLDAPYAVALARLTRDGVVELRADPTIAAGRPVLHREPGAPALAASGAPGLGLAPLAPMLLEGPPPAPLGHPWGDDRRAVLRVHPEALRAAVLQGAPAVRGAPALLPWLSEQVHAWRERPDAGLVAPSLAELTFLERHVATPLVHGSDADRALAARMAPLIDAEVWQIRDCGPVAAADGGHRSCRALTSGGEILVVAPGPSRLVVEATRVHDEAGTWRLAAELFSAAGARALLVAVGRAGAGTSAFTSAQALHQALASDVSAARAVAQVRGVGARPGTPGDALVIGRLRPGGGEPLHAADEPALARGLPGAAGHALAPARAGSIGHVPGTIIPVSSDTRRSAPVAGPVALGQGGAPVRAALPAGVADLLAPAGALAWVPRWRLVEDAPELAALVGVRDALLSFSSAFTADEAVVLWFPPALRRAYAVPDPCLELRRLAALDLVPQDHGCAEWVRDEVAAGLGGAALAALDARALTPPGPRRGPRPPADACVAGGPSGHVPSNTHPSARRGPAGPADPCAPGGPPGHVPSNTHASPAARAPGLDFDAAVAQLEAYAEAGNLHRLRRVLAEPTLRLHAGLGLMTARAFLSLCEVATPRRCAIVWLGPALPGRASVPRTSRAIDSSLWRRQRTLIVDPEAGR